MKEIWKPIKFYRNNKYYDFTNYYEVSNLGNVKALDRYITNKNGKNIFKKGIVLKQMKNNKGYDTVTLWKENKSVTVLVHRLVGFAFVPNLKNKPEIDHIIPVSNGGDNSADNLRWVYKKENRNNEYTLNNTRGSGDKRSIPIIYVNSEGQIFYYAGMRECERKGVWDNSNINIYCKKNSLTNTPIFNRKGETFYYAWDYIIKFKQIHIKKRIN